MMRVTLVTKLCRLGANGAEMGAKGKEALIPVRCVVPAGAQRSSR